MGGSGQLGVQGLDHFGLFFGDLDDADSVWLLIDLRTGLRVVAEFLTRLGAAEEREGLTGNRRPALAPLGAGNGGAPRAGIRCAAVAVGASARAARAAPS